MIQQLMLFACACDIFFGKHSMATISIKALINVIKMDKQLFKAIKFNWEFASLFVFAEERRMQIWFDSISNASDQLDVDDSPLNFSDLIKAVKYRNFFQLLPPSFAKQDVDSKKRPGKEKSKGIKKKKESKNVINQTPIPEFKLLPSETWINNFANKKEGRVT